MAPKTTPETPPRDEPAHASEAKPARVDDAKGGGNTPGKRPQTSEEFLALHPEKRAKPCAVAPLPVVLTPSEMDRRAVLEALGHDADGKCPAGIDWRTSQTPAERRTSRYNYTGESPRLDDSPCGWWWCGKELKAERWAELHKAVEVLRKAGIDPCCHGVAYDAGQYARDKAWLRRFPDLKAQESVDPALREMLGIDNPHFERVIGLAKQAVDPKDSGGPARGVATYRLLLGAEHARQGGEEWWGTRQSQIGDTWWPQPATGTTPAIAAAILVVFGLNLEPDGKYSTLKLETHRLETAWPRAQEWSREKIAEYRRKMAAAAPAPATAPAKQAR